MKYITPLKNFLDSNFLVIFLMAYPILVVLAATGHLWLTPLSSFMVIWLVFYGIRKDNKSLED